MLPDHNILIWLMQLFKAFNNHMLSIVIMLPLKKSNLQTCNSKTIWIIKTWIYKPKEIASKIISLISFSTVISTTIKMLSSYPLRMITKMQINRKKMLRIKWNHCSKREGMNYIIQDHSKIWEHTTTKHNLHLLYKS